MSSPLFVRPQSVGGGMLLSPQPVPGSISGLGLDGIPIANPSSYGPIVDYGNPLYDAVARRETTAWAIPYQDLDENGIPEGPAWYINLKDRALLGLSDSERTQLIAYRRR